MFKLVRATGLEKEKMEESEVKNLDEDLSIFEEDFEEERKQLEDDRKKKSTEVFTDLVKGFRKNKPANLVRTFSMHKKD